MSYAYVVQMDIPQHLDTDFNRIYDEEHVPTILKVPGVRSCTRYRLEHSTIPSADDLLSPLKSIRKSEKLVEPVK